MNLYLIQFMVAESFKILYFIYIESQVRLKCESLLPCPNSQNPNWKGRNWHLRFIEGTQELDTIDHNV